MTLPPRWKVKRELWRIRDQIERRVNSAILDGPRQYIYDRLARKSVSIREGLLPLTERVAVVVLFQPKGIAASTLFTLDHLIANRWSPLIVSNANLSGRDAGEIASRSALVIERPNVGYDFGAYREAINHLEHTSHKLDRLILLNDSTWFPLRKADDTLQRMEAEGADVIGHIYKIEDPARRWNDHVESHLLMFGENMMRSQAFKNFWRNYVMSDSRDTTIEKGEKGITQMGLAEGWSVRGLLTREWLVGALRELDDNQLREVLLDVVHHREDASKHCDRLLQSSREGDNWREDFIAWVDSELSNSLQHLLSATFIAPAMVYGGQGFVKKSSGRRFHLARMKVLSLEKEGRIPELHPAVRREMEKAVAKWQPPFDWRRKPGASLDNIP